MVDGESNNKYKIVIIEHSGALRKNVANLAFNHHNFQPRGIEDNVSTVRLARFTEGLETHTAHFVIAASKVLIITVHL